jgi:integrase
MAMAKVRCRVWRTASGEERRAHIADYVDQHGKRHIKTFPGARGKEAADAWLVEQRYRIANGTHTPESTSATLREAIGGWLERAAAERLEFGTQQQYRQHRDHILKLIDGRLKLAKLTRARVEQLRDELLKHHSREMARKVLVSFKSILRDSCRRGLVAQNVAAETSIGANGRHRKRLKVGVDVPTPHEIRAMLETDDPKAKAMMMLAALAGLRASELRALRWPHLDLGSKPTVTIEERADKWARVGSPKSATSRRTIPLGKAAVRALMEWKVSQPGGRALLFGTGADKPDMLGNLQARVLDKAQLRAGVVAPVLKKRKMAPKYSWHALRHYAISAWLAAGIDPKTVQTWAGHSSLVLTLDVYGHMIPRTDDHARIEAAEAALVA